MKLVFSRIARQDLADIVLYIQDNLNNPIAARNTAKRIGQSVRRLQGLPRSGARLDITDNRLAGYRYTLAGNYLVLYRTNGELVEIVRIVYAKSNFKTALRDQAG